MAEWSTRARRTTAGTLVGSGVEAVADELPGLMLALQSRNEQALGRLYDLTVDRVFGLALRILGVAADAEEVVVDVYRQVWQRAAAFDAQRGSGIGWIMVIAHSRALDHLRRRLARPDQAEVHPESIERAYVRDDQPGVEDMLDAIQQGTRVHQALAQLKPEQRQLIGMAFLRGMSHPEIVEASGMPLGTVKSHIRRGLATLRAILGREDLDSGC
jgi:RNA polymerase sigma-70 factor, ECF subfamily